jgi:serine protease Do
MSAEAPRLKALAVIALVGVAMGGAAMIALRPGEAAPLSGPELVAAPPRPVSAAAVRPAEELGESFIALSEAVTPAVVRIEAEHSSAPGVAFGRRLQDIFGLGPGAASGEDAPEIAGGTGFLVSADGYILTNHHVIEGATRISVALADKRTFTAQVVGSDPLTDVAVIRIPASGLPAVPLGDSDSTRVGEWVLAIGNPGFEGASSTLDFTVTGGIISAKGRGLEVLSPDDSVRSLTIEDFIQTDAVINPGNSGGPLVNLRGAVIGINTAIASTTGSYQGYGFAIPSNLVKRVMRDLVEYGYMRRALLGVQITDVTAEDAEVYGLPSIAGVLVEDFNPGSSAERAGVQRHDVIVALDDRPVSRLGELQQRVAQHDPGETVTLTVYRYGKPLRYSIPLQEGPRRDGVSRTAVTSSAPPGGLGIEVVDLDATEAARLQYSRAGGAVISRVVPGSAAYYKEVGEWHRIVTIDRRAVPNAREARRLLREARSGSVVSLLLETSDAFTYIANVRVP